MAEQPDAKTVPQITDLIDLPMLGACRLSPDGRRLAYLVSRPDWRANRHEARGWVHDLASGARHQLTRWGSVSRPRWTSADDLALLRGDPDAPEAGAQIWLFEGLVGEGRRVTEHEGGITAFEPFAGGLLYLAPDPERRKRKARTERFGSFRHQERETSADSLYYLSLPRLRAYEEALRRASGEAERAALQRPVVDLGAVLPEPLSIFSFAASPTGDAIYLTCTPGDDLVHMDETRCFRLRLDPEAALEAQLRIDAAKAETEAKAGARGASQAEGGDRPEALVAEGQATGDGSDAGPERGAAAPGAASDTADRSHLGQLTELATPEGAWLGPVAPDGARIVLRYRERDRRWLTQTDLFLLDLEQPEAVLTDAEALRRGLRCVSRDFDQEPHGLRWTEDGLFVAAVEGTGGTIVRLSSDAPPVALDFGDLQPDLEFDVAAGRIAFVGASAERMPELQVAALAGDGRLTGVVRLTDLGAAVAGWQTGSVETIRWTSRDGAEIEGVLRKPPGFEPGRRYPLAFLVHGGPSWASRAWLLEGDDRRYYPSLQLAARGVLVLKPNYRGSTGRGQAFLELNAGNLGVGDLWDLESAIDALDAQGLVDPERVGCMGWSQGGYISAMAGLRSTRFAAVSVGAGISDWYTYHLSNDIPQFTEHYLGASPFEDREAYRRTAPIEGLGAEAAPMLIQHGAQDQRVPLSNAMELFRGLQAKGVPVELFVYPDMGHPITRPRENRAVMWQNLVWFARHLLGESLDFFDDALADGSAG